MDFYPFGNFAPKPEWFRKAMAECGMNGDKVKVFFLDDDPDKTWDTPAAYVLDMPPGYRLLRHGHPCERVEVVVRGELEVGDGRIARPGDIFTAKANTLYGPHTAGPEGCTTIEIFSRIEAMFNLVYEGPDGEYLVANALKGEMAPGYVPLPDDGDVAL